MPKLPDELRRPIVPVSTESLANGNGHRPKVSVVQNGREKPGSGDRLGINPYDLNRLLQDERANTLKMLNQTRVVRVDKEQSDEVALVFVCNLSDAARLCDTIRSWDAKAGDRPTRVYLCKNRVWERLPGKALLSLVDGDGRVRLNPKWFTVKVLPGDLIPPPMEIPSGQG